jgi:hypothetical protein
MSRVILKKVLTGGQGMKHSFTGYRFALIQCLTYSQANPLRYPTFCVRFAALHKSFVRATGQLTRSKQRNKPE